MPSKQSYHRTRPSVDKLVDMLADLDDTQMESLLQEMNNTTPANVAVAKGIDFFERPTPTLPSGASATTPPPRRRKPLASISTFNLRSEAAKQHQASRISSAPEVPRPRSEGFEEEDIKEAARQARAERYNTPRSYKRISRPWASGLYSPATLPDLRELLAAYLSGSPSTDSMSSGASSPTTPMSGARFAPSMILEADGPGLDLLEPSPTRHHRGFARQPEAGAGPADGMSGIFEVLSKV